jgi:hypothetical protein
MTRPAGLLTLATMLLLGYAPAHSAVIAQPPGQAITVLSEHALVVFDPLAGTQTLILQHIFEGTSTPSA